MVDKEQAMFFVKEVVEDNETKMKYISEFFDKCSTAQGDRCEKSYRMSKCMDDELHKVRSEFEML